MKILIFGDSNAFIPSNIGNFDFSLQKYDGLYARDAEWYLDICLNEDNYDLLILMIGTNDYLSGIDWKTLVEHLEHLCKITSIAVSPVVKIENTIDGTHWNDDFKVYISQWIERKIHELQ